MDNLQKGKFVLPKDALNYIKTLIPGIKGAKMKDYKTHYEFLKTIELEKRPLKVFDDLQKPVDWTDVVFTEMKGFNWAFTIETAEHSKSETKDEIDDIVKDSELTEHEREAKIEQVIEFGKSKQNDFEYLILNDTIDSINSSEDVVEFTKQWLAKFFPSIKVEVIWDEETYTSYIESLKELMKDFEINLKNLKLDNPNL